MKTGTKIALFALLCVAMIVAGVILGRAIQDDPQEKDLTFAILVSAPGGFTVDMTPKNPTTGDIEVHVARGTPAVFTITTAAFDGYDGKIDFSISGLAEGTYSFNPSSVGNTPGTPVVLTVQTSTLTSNQGYVCTLTASPS